jgi:hypothetical protein
MVRFRDLKVGEKFSFPWSVDLVCEKVSPSCYRAPNGEVWEHHALGSQVLSAPGHWACFREPESATFKPVSDVGVIRK